MGLESKTRGIHFDGVYLDYYYKKRGIHGEKEQEGYSTTWREKAAKNHIHKIELLA